MNDKVLGYVQKTLGMGYGTESIKKYLIGQGYSQSDIDEAISFVKKGDAKVAKNQAVSTNYAGFWYRFSASIWDSIIIGIPLIILQIP